MARRLTFGVLGSAKIAREKVIPGMRACMRAEVVALASRDGGKARDAATALGIPRAHASYEAMLADASIDALYIPLPNHLHVGWTIRALEAGKHVLCEKPIALDAAGAMSIAEATARTGRHAVEAFMFRHHLQWRRALEIVKSGVLGRVHTVAAEFGYHQIDAANIRNRVETGGGAIYDIGCYGVAVARYLFEAEPQRVAALIDRDPAMGIDRLTSALMAFPDGRQASFSVSTQAVRHQRVVATGTHGRIEIAVPFTPPPAEPTSLLIDIEGTRREERIEPCDQYALQADAFAEAILGGKAPPYPISDAVAMMKTLDAIFRAGKTGAWEQP